MYYGNLLATQAACSTALAGTFGYNPEHLLSATRQSHATSLRAWTRHYGRQSKYLPSGQRACRPSTLAAQITHPSDWLTATLEG